MSKNVVIHTDGACSGNPGPGGWGAILQCGTAKRNYQGVPKGQRPTTGWNYKPLFRRSLF